MSANDLPCFHTNGNDSSRLCTAISLLRLILMVPCAIIEFGLGPILSHRKVMLDEKGIRKNRIASFQVVLIIAILIFLFPDSTYLLASFWMVVLHAIQLVITKLYKEVKKDEK